MKVRPGAPGVRASASKLQAGMTRVGTPKEKQIEDRVSFSQQKTASEFGRLQRRWVSRRLDSARLLHWKLSEKKGEGEICFDEKPERSSRKQNA